MVATQRMGEETLVFPDTLVGTDSHTTMINAIGVLGWGVGGIEAESAMLGRSLVFSLPEIVGVYLEGDLPKGYVATDIALLLTQMLRKEGVVGAIVEFYGPGVANMSLADRATISNMAPEFGATAAMFPVDGRTIDYLAMSARADRAGLVEAYAKAQLGASDPIPTSGTAFLSVREPDKAGVVGIAKSLIDLGFDLVATRGTAKVIEEAGISVRAVNKVMEGRPNIVDMIRNDEIDLIINTTEGRVAIRDSAAIRSGAEQHRVYYTTTLAGGEAVCLALAHRDEIQVRRLQDLHGAI